MPLVPATNCRAKGIGRLRGRSVLSAFLSAVVASAALAAPGAAQATAARVSVGSPADTTPQNHQNEPAVAIDANNPNFAVSGWNDFVDWQPCPQETATERGTCASPADSGVGLSAVGFSFDRGHSWVQPTYSGWTAGDCAPSPLACQAHPGPIHTLPWYYENNLVSSGDPAVAVGPIPQNGRFSWSNGSRVYYANLTEAFSPVGAPSFPNRVFRGFTANAVSRLDNPTPQSVLDKNSWKPPVLVNTHSGQTAFLDKEQIWADNAASSRFFGRVYLCSVQFRSVGLHNAPGGNFPAPLMVSVSPDGGNTWTTKQVTPAGTPGRGPNLWGLSGCTIRTDSQGVAYVFAEKFENPALVTLPTRGYHVMFKSFDGGEHWTKQQIVRQITDPCFFIDPVYGRCVMDGYAGARTDLAASPSVDIANGAPTGTGATDQIVDAWADASAGLNHEEARLIWSRDGGATWSTPVSVQLAGDRPMYVAPAIAPTGDRVYVVYEAVRDPWRGGDMVSPRRYHGVFLTAALGAGGAPNGWTPTYVGPDGDLRGTYPGHDIYQERIGDYVYAAATATYGLGVWTDARNAEVCPPVQDYRAASLAAGEHALPAPWPLSICPTFGNTDIWSATTD
ncbi:MAG: glycoside hydrolase [Chloroflexota bacterium]|nr:glycoside hydrolase [Chloroflexota bacterium]